MCFLPFSRVFFFVFIFIFIVLLKSSYCQSESNNSSGFCVSSCGNIKNISSPFRLNSDPFNCGHTGYELDCQNNQTFIYFKSKKYLVESINYNNLTIRVVDPGLINPTTNCSFPVNSAFNLDDDIPSDKYSLTWFYFSRKDAISIPSDVYLQTWYEDHYRNVIIVFISCINPISYPSTYINISFCRGPNTSSRNYGYIGILNQEAQYIVNLPETCGVEEVAFASANGPLAEKNSSLVVIHQGLAYGFELSWYLVKCGGCKRPLSSCRIEGNSTNVACGYSHDNYCNYTPIVQVDLSHLLIQIQSFSSRTSDFHKRFSPNHPPVRFSCYFLFWVTGVGELVIIVTGVLLIIRFFIGLVCLIVLVVSKWRRRHLSGDETIEDFLQGQTNILPIKYKYSDIKKMTNKFKHKLGEGGYGIVYKGKLRSGPLVAVKMTNKSISSEREFSNEVGTIGRVHHVNVVQLIGFCTEGSKRALVYEYMPNGSLDKYISPMAGQVTLTYKNMFDISLGVARGIDYLHKGCDMQILHFDIKPHNILLDENFKPKVSDFGLAKLYPTNVNTVTLPTTTLRGTTGYMAPELFYMNIGGVSYKADVYSFGMLLMELASRKENINPFAEDDGQIYFPSWVYDQLNDGKEIDLGNVSDEERTMIKKMIKVALWCIQMKPGNRPSMNKVVEMLEKDAELVHMPPRPFIAPDGIAYHENRITATIET